MLAAMLALTMLASMTGCSGSEKATSEPATETKADVAETVGQKANDEIAITEVKEPHRTLQWEEGTNYGIELYNEGDLEIACMSLGLGDASNICRLVIRVNENAQDQVLEWEDVRLWKESVPFRGEKKDSKSYLLKAGQFYLTDLYVEEDALNGKSISDCEDIVIQAKYGDNSFEMTVPVAEVNARTNREHESEQAEEKKVLFIEEQEIYNDNGLYAIIPEQELNGGALQISIENKRGSSICISFMNVLFNGDLVYEGSRNGSDMVLNADEADSGWIYLEDGLVTKMLESGTENGNISFTLFSLKIKGMHWPIQPLPYLFPLKPVIDLKSKRLERVESH